MNTTLAVFDYNNSTVDIIEVDELIIEAYGNEKAYLARHCGYNLDQILWMNPVKSVDYYKHNSFSADKDYEGGMYAMELANFKLHVRNNNGVLSATGFHQREDMMFKDGRVFGDDKEHTLTMLFYDGFAIQKKDEDPLILFYPTEQMVLSDATMKKEIENYCGREVQTPYEVALKYGKLYEFNEIPW